MKISDVSCPHCGTSYNVAESETVHGETRQFECEICGDIAASWTDDHLKVFRLIAPAEDAHFYMAVNAPPPLI